MSLELRFWAWGKGDSDLRSKRLNKHPASPQFGWEVSSKLMMNFI